MLLCEVHFWFICCFVGYASQDSQAAGSQRTMLNFEWRRKEVRHATNDALSQAFPTGTRPVCEVHPMNICRFVLALRSIIPSGFPYYTCKVCAGALSGLVTLGSGTPPAAASTVRKIQLFVRTVNKINILGRPLDGPPGTPRRLRTSLLAPHLH